MDTFGHGGGGVGKASPNENSAQETQTDDINVHKLPQSMKLLRTDKQRQSIAQVLASFNANIFDTAIAM